MTEYFNGMIVRKANESNSLENASMKNRVNGDNLC